MDASETGLRLYRALAAFKPLQYRGKILAVAFLGIHVPLIVLALWYGLGQGRDWRVVAEVLAVTLAATLLGTAATLFVLGRLLRPVLMTSSALRAWREGRERVELPSGYTDEVGTLMDDARQTLTQLDTMLDQLQYEDETTGLPNRKRFEQQLALRLGRGEPVAVAALHFGNLARLYETLDVRRADHAARLMAARLAAQSEFAAQLARVGAATFACTVPADLAQATAGVGLALQRCVDDLQIDDLVFKPVLLAGLAAAPRDASEAAALLDAAIASAIRADARTPVARHSPQARAAALDGLRLEQDLRRALERDEFSLQFQPVVDLQADRVVGAEALLRWTHPERGCVPPQRFIGVAEAAGLIEPIGRWVLERACAQARAWNEEGLSGLRMAVNLSAREFLNPALARQVIDAVRRSGIAPDQLEIELTETAAMADHAHTQRMFTALRDAGIRIAIDDFGTGYASMSYLRKLPFDKLKIDREFVTDVHRQRQSQAICAALIELSRGLHLQVLAEGAEQQDEVDYLAGQGCQLFQGFYFSRPVLAVEFVKVSSGFGGLQ